MASQPPKFSAGDSKTICVVTENLVGWGRRLEAGASMSAIAETLSSQGNEVTLLWVPGTQMVDEKEIVRVKNYYYDYFLITVEILIDSKDLLPNENYPARRSVAVYYYLKEHKFNAVYFALEGGLSYYTMLGKETGLFAPRPTLVIVAHSPIQWLSESDRYFLGTWDHVAVAHMEKLAVGLADRLICLSKNLLSWMMSHSWKLPDIVDTLPPLAPEQWRLRTDVETKRAITERCDEIALLAGPDYRDGLTLFCDAVDELAKTDIERVKLTAFGPFAQYLG